MLLTKKLNQKGVAHLLLILTVIGIVATILILNTFSFNSKIFSRLFVRDKSFASQPISGPIGSGSVNLVKNPGCSSGTNNWSSWQGTLSQANTGYNDTTSCKATVNGTNTAYSIDDSPNTVPYPKQGDQYVASAWVRSDNAASKQVQIVIRQQGGSKPTTAVFATYILSSSWQNISTISQVDAPDRTSLDIYIAEINATAGDSFQADDINLNLQYPPIANPSDPGNLLVNPSCELNVGGWGFWQGYGTRVTNVAHTGIASCQANYGGSGGAYTIDDSPNLVQNPTAGSVYSGSAWVRSDVAVGKKVGLILRQWKNGVVYKNVESTRIILSNNWQQLTNQITIDPGVTTVDIYVVQYGAIAGDNFQSDDISLKLASSPVQ